MTAENAARELAGFGHVLEQEPMSRHTTFGIGGPAEIYFKAGSAVALTEALKVGRVHDLPVFVLGSGSNILVGDEGLAGLVIENESRAVTEPVLEPDGQVSLYAESGLSFARFARRLCRMGYAGLEWAVGIPGSLGGAVVYNAGAYGGCLADVLHAVDVIGPSGNEERLPADALRLEYRGSSFTKGMFADCAVLGVHLRLRREGPEAIADRVAQLDAKRKAAQPPGRNAGSIFKNPETRPAWWYIDQVGLRGARCGGAQISAKHANFFMNVRSARAADVKALMDEAVRRVRDRFDVELHREIGLVGRGFTKAGAIR